jgi:diaminopimelate epimerase
MEYEIIRADPAGNITIMVLSQVSDKDERAELVRSLLSDKKLKAEQVGFVIPPAKDGAHWRLEMMGGEFCANAARSFGLWRALEQGSSGLVETQIEISGVSDSLTVAVDTFSKEASVFMPNPLKSEDLNYTGLRFPVIFFEGIAHVIAGGLEESEATFLDIKRRFEDRFPNREALGVMFYKNDPQRIIPAVYVYGSSSLVFESSCGSGSAAIGVWLSREASNGKAVYPITQPGGVLEVSVYKEDGRLLKVSIGGKISLSERMQYIV